MAMTGNKANVVLNWRIGWFGVRDEAKTGAPTNIALCAVSCVLCAVSNKHNSQGCRRFLTISDPR